MSSSVSHIYKAAEEVCCYCNLPVESNRDSGWWFIALVCRAPRGHHRGLHWVDVGREEPKQSQSFLFRSLNLHISSEERFLIFSISLTSKMPVIMGGIGLNRKLGYRRVSLGNTFPNNPLLRGSHFCPNHKNIFKWGTLPACEWMATIFFKKIWD